MKSLAQFANDLRALPRAVALKVAARAAPRITKLAEQTFDAGESPYGVAWDPSVDGKRVTLRKSGALFKFIRYVPAGAKLRVVLGVPYAKYQVGKRAVYPRQDSPLPNDYVDALKAAAAEVIKEELDT